MTVLFWGVAAFYAVLAVKWHINLSEAVKACPWIIRTVAHRDPWVPWLCLGLGVLTGIITPVWAWQHNPYSIPAAIQSAWLLRVWWYSRPPRPPRKRALAALRARVVPS